MDTQALAMKEREATTRQVLAWRFDELRRAGYSEEAAIELAEENEVDLHMAVALVRRGCPHDTALRILR